MGDPPTEHAPDYPWIHQQFVRAWERATAPSSVLGSITAPVAPVVQAAPPPPAPAPTRVSARIRARSPAATDKASTKRPRRSATPDSAAPPAKQPRRGCRRQTARANTVASSSPSTPRPLPKNKGKHQEKGKAKASEHVPSGSESEGEGQPVASSSKRVLSSKAVPVEKTAGSRRPSKKTAAGEARGPRAHRSGLPLFSPPVYPCGARIPAKKMERVRSAGFATWLLVSVLTLFFFLVHWMSRTRPRWHPHEMHYARRPRPL